MRSPAAAIAWEFRHRHRWALIALASYLLVLGLIKPLLLEPGDTVRFDPPDGFAALAVVPFSVAFFYLLAVFSFGLTGDLAARPSIYPTRLFTLPVTTAALAGWPMLYGGAAMVALWLMALVLARWPWGVELPLWPAFMAPAVLAWTQVCSWMPYGLRGLRVIAATVVLITLDTVVIVAIELQWSEGALIAFLAPQLPLAYLCACAAVARARRGVVPDWQPLFWRARAVDGDRVRPPFRSAAAAQFWCEWRRHGWSLPVLVGILLPFELGLLFITGYGSRTFVFELLLFVLVTPIVMAGFAAATVSKPNPFERDTYGVTPFTATRPLGTAELVAAKLKMAMLSTLATWILMLVAIPIGFSWAGADVVLIDWARWLDSMGRPRAIVAALLLLGGLMVATCQMLVQSLYLGLSGREWIVKTSGFVGLVIVMAIGPLYEWIADNVEVRRWLWDGWPMFPVGLVALKMTAAIWVAARLFRSRLISDRTLLFGAAGWTLVVFALYGVLVWWVDTAFIPRHILAVFAILAVPLVRVSAAPLALAWNRHR